MVRNGTNQRGIGFALSSLLTLKPCYLGSKNSRTNKCSNLSGIPAPPKKNKQPGYMHHVVVLGEDSEMTSHGLEYKLMYE